MGNLFRTETNRWLDRSIGSELRSRRFDLVGSSPRATGKTNSAARLAISDSFGTPPKLSTTTVSW